MKTLKELADIGTEAASKETDDMSISISPFSCHWQNEEPARQAFAQAVRDAVLADLVTKPDSSPKWKLPDPPEGREWHRADWTKEMLPDGYRPLLLDEVRMAGDECLVVGGWSPSNTGYRTVRGVIHCRTTRPLPPVTKTVLLDINDIRATDEFKSQLGATIFAPNFWDTNIVRLGIVHVAYADLATNYLRRQHGSTEWKPCTKEVTV